MTRRRGSSAAFTLVELIIVMALLAIMAMIVMPRLGASMKERYLGDEARHFLAATEYARNEAESQGVPMVIWADLEGHRLGIEAKAGFDGAPARDRDYVWNPDVYIQADQAMPATGRNVTLMEFAPDGSPSETSVETVTLSDRFGHVLVVARTTDRWSYEIQKANR